jgi:hypothetical protein
MSGLGRVSATDVVRSFGENIESATPASIKSWLEKNYLRNGGGGFSYDPAIKGLTLGLQNKRLVPAIRDLVGNAGRPCGRPYNQAVFDAVEPFIDNHEGPVHKLPYVAAKIGVHKGLGIHIGLKVPLVRIFRGSARLVIPAFRNSFVPTWQQSALECSIAIAFLAQNDFYGVEEFEYVCVRSAGSALDRVCTVYNRSDLSLIGVKKVNELLTSYFQAVVMLIDEDKGLGTAGMAGYTVVNIDGADDPGSGGLFQ